MERAQPASVGAALRRSRGLFVFVALFSGVINLLALTGAIYMLQVYDRVLPSRSVPTLVGLTILMMLLFCANGLLDLIRTRIYLSSNAFDDRQRPFDGRMMSGGAPAPNAGMPALMSATATPPSAQPGAFSLPTGQAGMAEQLEARVLQWVMQDPQRRGPILDERFGPGASQKLMEFMQPKAPRGKAGTPSALGRKGAVQSLIEMFAR
jgi:hypothetical protein